jgi:hypothetical protein
LAPPGCQRYLGFTLVGIDNGYSESHQNLPGKGQPCVLVRHDDGDVALANNEKIDIDLARPDRNIYLHCVNIFIYLSFLGSAGPTTSPSTQPNTHAKTVLI